MILKTPGFLTGKILEEVKSPINGKITVLKSVGLGTYFQVADLTQSGGVIFSVWKTTLKRARKRKSNVKNIAILGMGGGSAAGLVREYWPDARIEGVDIDPLMVDLGKKYLGLKANNIVIKDAKDYLEEGQNSFDLILIDTYLGDEYPEKFVSEDFINLVKKRLKRDGLAIFNRLYYGQKRSQAVRFGEKLDRTFSEVERVYPEANLMFFCFK
jgi:spermidine synthase